MALGLGSEVSIGSRILGFSVAQESWNRASLNRCLCLPKALLLAGCHVLVGGVEGGRKCVPGHTGKCSFVCLGD